MVEVSWNWQANATSEVEMTTWEGIQRAAVHLHTRLLEVLNVSAQPYRATHPTRRTPSGRRASITRYRSPSQPGEPPRKRTGWLQRHVRYQPIRSQQVVRIGVAINARYGLYLEYGTRRMAARPWLRTTIVSELPRLRAIIKAAAREVGRRDHA